MAGNEKTGAEIVAELAGKDLNKDGRVVNLVICGNSKFYDYSWLENQLDLWVEQHAYPDMIILGGASGVDFLAERCNPHVSLPWTRVSLDQEDDGDGCSNECSNSMC